MKTTLLLISLSLACSVFAQDYVPTVIWDRSGETDSSAYGYEILPLGDQNDDGYADWAVLARGNVATYHGTRGTYLEFFYGSENLSTEPAFVLTQDDSEYYQTWFATEAGDLNGDGYVDWYVSFAPWNAPGSRTYGFFWGGSEPSQTPDFLWPSETGWYRMQDFNGDGYDDLYSTDAAEVGRMYFGGNPMDTLPDWIINQPPQGINQSIPYAIGDFTGDGVSDFICYNPNNGNLAVFLGGVEPDTIPAYFWTDMMRPIGGVKSLNGDAADEFLLSRNVHFGDSELSPTPNYTLDFACQGSGGLYPASAGDFNGDGYRDLLLWTPSCVDNPFGALTLHLGYSWLNAEPAFSIEGDTDPLDLRGIYTATGLGDVNGDGIDDIAIGAWHSWFAWRGRCIIIAGDDSLEVSADDSRPELPRELTVSAYPNPFNSNTTIQLALPTYANDVDLHIFNLLGQEVFGTALSVTGGELTYHYDASELSTGLYLLHVSSGNFHTTTKLMVLK